MVEMADPGGLRPQLIADHDQIGVESNLWNYPLVRLV